MFIHGAMGTHDQWEKQMRFFSKNFQVFAVDLPGHGRSDPPRGEISINYYSTLISDLIARLDLEKPVVCGHSMGGAIGLQLAIDRPNLLGALVLVGTGAKLGVHPDILTAFRTNCREAIEQFLGPWAFSKKADQVMIKAVIQQLIGIKPTIAVADWEACDAFDCRDRLEELQLPTLIIVGEEDKLTPVWYSEYLLKQIRGSTLEKIPEAGHYVMLEKPGEFNKAMLSFLK